MKRILYLVLTVVILAACKKDKGSDPTPDPTPTTIYGQWDVHATAQPFSTDTTWKPIKRTDELISLYLFSNGKYISQKYPDKIVEGTFTVADSANTNIKVLTMSNEGEPIKLYIQLLPTGELKIDDESITTSLTGYTSRKFVRRVECTVILSN